MNNQNSELKKYIGLGMVNKRMSSCIIIACGVNEITNELIGFSVNAWDTREYILIKEEEYVHLKPLKEIVEKYRKDHEVFLRLGEKSRNYKASENAKDYMHSIVKFFTILTNYSSLEFLAETIDEDLEKKFYLQELKKAEKGLKRIKKRLHHYFPDEDIDYIIEHYRFHAKYYEPGMIERNYGNMVKFLNNLDKLIVELAIHKI